MRIAIIGGIGSGKSTVLNIIKKMGYPVLSADEINRELLDDEKYVRLLSAAFPDVVDENGVVNKGSLRDQIFEDKAKRRMLNNIAHPIIRQKVELVKADPLFVEVPLIVESGMHEDFDELILVTTNIFKRKKRIKLRNQMKGSQVDKIVRAQMSDKELQNYATIVIKNNGCYDSLRENVCEVVDFLLSKKDSEKK